MTVTLHAQPYDRDARGFYFEDFEIYKTNAAIVKNSYGQKVEEFEIQFIEGSELYCDFAKAYGVNQANLAQFYNAIEEWGDDEKVKFIIAVGECSYHFDPDTVHPDDFDVAIYNVENLKELAEQFIDEGYFGEIAESLQFYIDHDLIARDLSVDYTETTIAGNRLVYRCD